MKSILKPLSILLVLIIFTSCKKEITLSEYKYADKEFTVKCDGINPELLKEAVFSFENDVTKYYERNGKSNLSQAYSRTVTYGMYGNAKYIEMVSPHTIEIFNLLKGKTDLWSLEGKTKTLNYNHELIACLANNLKDHDLKTTFNALLTTNSMSPKLIGAPLRRKAHIALKDQHLATYIALDMYYAKLFDVDFSNYKEEKSTISELEAIKNKQADPHAGHNH